MTPSLFILTKEGWWILALALLLDLAAGDPESLPHPIRLIGKAISRLEPYFRSIPVQEQAQGAVFAIFITTITGFSVYAALRGLAHILFAAYWATSIAFIYYAVSLKCLADEALAVKATLERDGLEAARIRVSRIVGRDTARLDETGVVMAVIETVAENMVDGVISPFFYAAIGGPVLAMCYKAVNTLDSMIGYKDARYLRFGTWGAKMDDGANYIPARLSVPIVAIAAVIQGHRQPIDIFMAAVKDGAGHDGPNSGLPEAAFAAALDVRLSGPAWYKDRYIDRPFLNPSGRDPCTDDIDKAVRLLYQASAVFFGLLFETSLFIRLFLAV
ncbi:adenosylcobinamide-phosphate synthase CbiB [Dissulfurimicrobium hydrothermale]|uniref:adenosylcobinamide-phosphate synthase CbiB n=1 Tax=Dissulfurimicrobium hydrothermale TaxID=1750598 RepID=UPI001EDB7234|nr:adenosylcobinamide-phosphate synthase CbiB [Dissulfurimicrobium hydrothermale]UKL13657.1 adenosylcobinamide-phosphate synthase CbiB [Dissulfurimicrobium hydrothermale]